MSTALDRAVAGALADALIAAIAHQMAILNADISIVACEIHPATATIDILLSDGRAFCFTVAEMVLLWGATPQEECGAGFTTGGPDPYGTDCDLPHGHYPATKHSGPDPFGSDRRVRWNGGGSCAGDPLPARDVEWS